MLRKIFLSFLSFFAVLTASVFFGADSTVTNKILTPASASVKQAVTNVKAPNFFSQTNAAAVISTGTNTNSAFSNTNNKGLSLQDLLPPGELNPSSMDPSKNFIFDNYDEVAIDNYDRQNLTLIKFSGNVVIRFADNSLKARTVIITISSNNVQELTAFDRVDFKYAGTTYLADTLVYNPSTHQGLLNNVRSYAGASGTQNIGPLSGGGGWYYKARKATILNDGSGVLEDTYFTYSSAEFPPYQFFAQKLWYYKDSLVFAVNDTYIVGENNFIYFPFFFRWERLTGIKTSFGIEKNIGWYIMNDVDLNTADSHYAIGADIYERLGQFGYLNYNNKKPIGPFNTLTAKFEGANDTRIFYDQQNNRYTQMVLVNGVFTNIQQLSWYYSANASVIQNGLNIGLNWEDINDPFFRTKYNQRKNTFDFREVIQPSNNVFFNHQDVAPTVNSLNRGISLSYSTVSITGNWSYLIHDKFNGSNAYLNERYDYILDHAAFPIISISLPRLDILKDMNYTYPVSKTITFSNTNVRVPLEEDETNFVRNFYISSASNTNAIITNTNNNQSEVLEKNYALPVQNTRFGPMSLDSAGPTNDLINSPAQSMKGSIKYSLATNQYVLYNFSSGITGNFNYDSSEYYDTNGRIKSDLYNHNENGSINFDGTLLNSLINLHNSLNINNHKRWSSFPLEFTNNLHNSGLTVDYHGDIGTTPTPTLYKSSTLSLTSPNSVGQTVDFQLYRSDFGYTNPAPRTLSLGTSAGTGLTLAHTFGDYNVTAVNYRLSANHFIKYRITNDIIDDTNDNITERTIGANTSLSLYWLSVKTGTSLNILETKSRKLILDYNDFTNRIIAGQSPRLTFSFIPAPLTIFQPMPTINYVYDLILKTNISFSVDSAYTINNLYGTAVYKIESLNFHSRLDWDFLSPRSTHYAFDINSTFYLDPNWILTFSTSIRNDRIYRYSRENAAKFNEPYVDFWDNLKDSLSLLDYGAMKRSFFKLQNLNFSATHNIDDWLLTANFTMSRIVDETRMLSYWEPAFNITFSLNGNSKIFDPYEKKFIPEELQN